MIISCRQRMLRCLWKGGPNIDLIPNQEVPLGRTPETTVTDLKCPRHHVNVVFDDKTQTATVRPFVKSTNQKPFGINGKVFDDQQVLRPDDVLELLPGKHKYRFEIPAASGEMATISKTLSVSVVQTELLCQRPDEQTITEQTSTVAVSVVAKVVPSKPGWVHVSDDLMVYTTEPTMGSKKVAGFDLDGTLIKTKSGRTWGKDADDWQFAFTEVPGKLKQLRKDGYSVVIFTNQRGISTGSGLSREEFQKKIERILAKLGSGAVSACFVAPKEGRNRKPMTGMWDELEKNYNDGISIDRSQSLYVGDAAGRGQSDEKAKDIKKRSKDESPKDHSCSDRLFAMNLGVKFLTPEEFFLGHPPKPFKLPEFSPKALMDQRSSISLLNPPTAQLARSDKKPELILLVGYPASGKTHFYDTYSKPLNYAYVSRDVLKTWQKCVQETEKLLKAGRSVVVDNTNPDSESRKRYVDVAKANGAPCRCFLMTCTYEQAMHNNKFRQLLGPDKEHQNVNVMVLNTYRKNFEQPSINEGFEEIVDVNFVPKFDDPEQEKLYGMYLLEK